MQPTEPYRASFALRDRRCTLTAWSWIRSLRGTTVAGGAGDCTESSEFHDDDPFGEIVIITEVSNGSTSSLSRTTSSNSDASGGAIAFVIVIRTRFKRHVQELL